MFSSLPRPSASIRRLEPVVRALAELEVDSDQAAEAFPKIKDILQEHKVTPPEFMMLDSKPGYWGYRYQGNKEWHWKLRRFRNSSGLLKEALGG